MSSRTYVTVLDSWAWTNPKLKDGDLCVEDRAGRGRGKFCDMVLVDT